MACFPPAGLAPCKEGLRRSGTAAEARAGFTWPRADDAGGDKVLPGRLSAQCWCFPPLGTGGISPHGPILRAGPEPRLLAKPGAGTQGLWWRSTHLGKPSKGNKINISTPTRCIFPNIGWVKGSCLPQPAPGFSSQGAEPGAAHRLAATSPFPDWVKKNKKIKKNNPRFDPKGCRTRRPQAKGGDPAPAPDTEPGLSPRGGVSASPPAPWLHAQHP